MTRTRGTPSPEVRALLDEERAIPALPATVRARALARARAALAAGVVAPTSRPVVAPRASLPARWAASVALVCVASAALGAAAYGIHLHRAREEALVATGPVPARPVRAVLVRAAAAPKAPEPPASMAPVDEVPLLRPRVMPPPRLSPGDAVHAELRLLRPARAAVAREDFAAALPPIAEHARRFKDGRLAEEREALRVKALVGLGHADEARRAAAAFRARFPHSVLLPAVGEMSAAGR